MTLDSLHQTIKSVSGFRSLEDLFHDGVLPANLDESVVNGYEGLPDCYGCDLFSHNLKPRWDFAFDN